MNEYQEQVFNMLNIEPNKPFELKEFKNVSFTLTEDLRILETKSPNDGLFNFITIRDLLLEKYHINTPISLRDQIIINYAKMLGYKWILIFPNEKTFAYVEKPYKDGRFWHTTGNRLPIKKPDFLPVNSTGSEPYYIGD